MKQNPSFKTVFKTFPLRSKGDRRSNNRLFWIPAERIIQKDISATFSLNLSLFLSPFSLTHTLSLSLSLLSLVFHHAFPPFSLNLLARMHTHSLSVIPLLLSPSLLQYFFFCISNTFSHTFITLSRKFSLTFNHSFHSLYVTHSEDCSHILCSLDFCQSLSPHWIFPLFLALYLPLLFPFSLFSLSIGLFICFERILISDIFWR